MHTTRVVFCFISYTYLLKKLTDGDYCLYSPFSHDEVDDALHALHKSKAARYNGIIAEHLQYTGPALIDLLVSTFNAILSTEYVPVCCHLGIQIHLYKGKYTCVLDPNNYIGAYNLIISRWMALSAISDLQGARKTLLLQETVAASMEARNKRFVDFFDVTKAFDSVWLFFQTVRTWC